VRIVVRIRVLQRDVIIGDVGDDSFYDNRLVDHWGNVLISLDGVDGGDRFLDRGRFGGRRAAAQRNGAHETHQVKQPPNQTLPPGLDIDNTRRATALQGIPASELQKFNK
jgi:hypothetical protein